MQDVVLGLLALAVGLLFCFRGYLTMRLIIPIWGTFAGFVLGAAIVSSSSGDGFLRTGLSWAVGAVVGLIFGLLAYLYFEVSVVLAMAAIGFSLGVSAMVALGVSWSWLILIVVSVGVLLAVVALAGNLPMMLLTVLTATSGASTVVGGIMLLTDRLQSDSITSSGSVTDRLHDDWWWYAIWGGLVVAGVIAQISAVDRIRGTMREAWDESKA